MSGYNSIQVLFWSITVKLAVDIGFCRELGSIWREVADVGWCFFGFIVNLYNVKVKLR